MYYLSDYSYLFGKLLTVKKDLPTTYITATHIVKNLSQKTIGKVINKSQQGYDHIEKRRAKLAIEDFKKLCEFYNALFLCNYNRLIKARFFWEPPHYFATTIRKK